MSIITATNLSRNFGATDIFQNISFQLPPNARVAIVGPNGIGKTTLLRILIGQDQPSSGTLHIARGARLGYLAQEAVLNQTHTLWEECLSALQNLLSLEAEIAALEHQISTHHTEDLLERYGRLQIQFEQQGGYTYPARIKHILTGLGFDESDYAMPLPQLSGGQRTRAVLARLLLSSPDLLILDEPTNHLDIHAVEWLEGYLSQWQGAALIVSHDRYFLDRVCNQIWELTPNGLETYRGNYSAYVQQRQERWQRREETFQSEKEKLLKEIEYIKKNISGQNTLQAKGKLKRLTRIVQAIEQAGLEAVLNSNWSELAVTTTTSPFSVEEAERRVRALHLASHRPPQIHLHLHARQRSGNIILRTRSLLIGYPGNPLFTVPDLELRRQECAALIGPNGAGKTTFLKTILGKLPPLQGETTLGASLQIGYFAQAHEDLHPQNSLMQEIERVAPHFLPGQTRDHLGKFHFSGDEVFKTVNVLSGGERGRLALAKLALSGANLLLLDEPTNHLDIPSQEILQTVLDEFQGTILLVSHDRYLIDALASQIWEIQADERTLEVFPGTYSEYRTHKESLAQKAELAGADGESRTRKEDYAQKARERNRIQAEERRRTAQIERLEAEIHALEQQLSHVSAQLANPPTDPTIVEKLGNDYLHLQAQLAPRYTQWEQLQTE
ncbi:MAG: ABC-F family ATP-binding cassette domain-containing protein [Anaerolineales bacterium]